jgi:aspartyl-tRNA(Asn)/glutamyl-tRNA(Gln) amidotransferase subunit B
VDRRGPVRGARGRVSAGLSSGRCVLDFEPVIGFEVHAQITTRTKIFCGCANEVGGEPNSRTCPVCLGMPGALPVLNEAVVDAALAVALALGADVARRSGFSRKNYFYPDLPKGYQITQHEWPLATGGHLDIVVDGRVRRVGIRQIHIEEDAGKSVHSGHGAQGGSLIDMNRCGVPLVEIVTNPDLRGIDEADAFLGELRRILVYLGVATGEMHEGSLRFDTNISIRPAGSESMGAQTEIKNLNSFRSVRRALEHEVDRQRRIVGDGGRVLRETLLWDEAAGRAVPMRSKEGASDYRYFPEPDLVDFEVDERRLERVRGAMPELPAVARERLVSLYGLPEYDASVLTAERRTLDLYEATVRAALAGSGSDEPKAVAKTVSNWVMVVLQGYLNEHGETVAELADRVASAVSGAVGTPTDALASRLAGVIAARLKGEVSEPAARRLFDAAMSSGAPVSELVRKLGLAAIVDEDAVRSLVAAVLAEHPDEVSRYRAGEGKLARFFVGQVLGRCGGRADPELVNRALAEQLERGR